MYFWEKDSSGQASDLNLPDHRGATLKTADTGYDAGYEWAADAAHSEEARRKELSADVGLFLDGLDAVDEVMK